MVSNAVSGRDSATNSTEAKPTLCPKRKRVESFVQHLVENAEKKAKQVEQEKENAAIQTELEQHLDNIIENLDERLTSYIVDDSRMDEESTKEGDVPVRPRSKRNVRSKHAVDETELSETGNGERSTRERRRRRNRDDEEEEEEAEDNNYDEYEEGDSDGSDSDDMWAQCEDCHMWRVVPPTFETEEETFACQQFGWKCGVPNNNEEIFYKDYSAFSQKLADTKQREANLAMLNSGFSMRVDQIVPLYDVFKAVLHAGGYDKVAGSKGGFRKINDTFAQEFNFKKTTSSSTDLKDFYSVFLLGYERSAEREFWKDLPKGRKPGQGETVRDGRITPMNVDAESEALSDGDATLDNTDGCPSEKVAVISQFWAKLYKFYKEKGIWGEYVPPTFACEPLNLRTLFNAVCEAGGSKTVEDAQPISSRKITSVIEQHAEMLPTDNKQLEKVFRILCSVSPTLKPDDIASGSRHTSGSLKWTSAWEKIYQKQKGGDGIWWRRVHLRNLYKEHLSAFEAAVGKSALEHISSALNDAEWPCEIDEAPIRCVCGHRHIANHPSCHSCSLIGSSGPSWLESLFARVRGGLIQCRGCGVMQHTRCAIDEGLISRKLEGYAYVCEVCRREVAELQLQEGSDVVVSDPVSPWRQTMQFIEFGPLWNIERKKRARGPGHFVFDYYYVPLSGFYRSRSTGFRSLPHLNKAIKYSDNNESLDLLKKRLDELVKPPSPTLPES